VLIEERVQLRRELSAMVARSPFGQGAAWPVVETVQRDGICVLVIAPAPALPDDVARAAQQLAFRLAPNSVSSCARGRTVRDHRRRTVVNELAMRPHNSGHWTMDGARTSQFEQHLRAVLDYPLGDTGAIVPVTVMANVLGAAQPPAMKRRRAVAPPVRAMPTPGSTCTARQSSPVARWGTSTFSALRRT